MNGALPPSSIDVRLTVSAPWRNSVRPTGVEPVNDSARTRVSSQSACDTRGPLPVITLNSPPSSPACSASAASASAQNGVSLAGRTSTLQPAARAAAALRVIMASGKFQGVMMPATPTGS